MTKIRHKILLLSLLIMLTGCGTIDNYLLGKDNTASPAELSPIKNHTLNVFESWHQQVGKGTDGAYLEMSPALDTNSVYTADIKGHVMAFNRNTGKKLWENELNTDLISGPSIGDGYLAVTSKEAQVIVLDTETGKKLWKKTVSNEVFAPPTIADGNVFVNTVDGKLYAFNETDGQQAWLYDHGTTALVMRAGSSPQVMFGVVVAGFSDAKLVGLRADTGQLLWEKIMATPHGVSDVERIADIDSDPLILDGTAYVASYQQNVSALSLQSGELIWEKNNISTFVNMVATPSTLYVVDNKSVIWAINRESGTVLWQQKAFHNRRLSAPVIVLDKALVVGDYQGFVHWISLEDGTPLNRTRPSHSSIYSQPIVDGNSLYILTSNGRLVAYKVE
jgi:outer membrane protein assembly factor BamB